MRRGPKPAKAKVKAQPPVTRKSPKNDGARVVDLEKRLAEALQREADASEREAEALAQQTAMAEILRVISTSPTNLQQVLDAVVRSAARFCGAPDASIFRLDGENLRADAHHGPVSQPPGFLVPLVRGTVAGRSVLERQAIAVTDLRVETDEYPEGSALARQTGQRATLSVPLLRDGTPIGVILLRRRDAISFTGKQIALLKIFADQAVIAIENVRLFNETKEALDRQTATSEILSVISTSPTDVQPVFDAIARHAVALCGGVGGIVVRYDGTVMRLAAYHNVSAKSRELHETEYPRAPDRTVPLGAAIVDRTIVHVPNLQASTRFAGSPVQRSGRGSMIAVPLLCRGEAIGAIGITRDKPQGFSDRDIALLQTFADQAVIAIENVRLFTELESRNHDLTEALDQQTATSDILRVISSSPTDAQPVFDTIAHNASALCGGEYAIVVRLEGDVLHLVAQHNVRPEAVAATERLFPRQVGRDISSGRAILDRTVVHIPDVERDSDYAPEAIRAQIARSYLSVPMLREGVPLGAIGVSRTTPGPFSSEQIALLQTFADQAVIAIENVRLFKKLEARNRDLTATGEILRVISRSPTDAQPVFDTIADNAVRLFTPWSVAVYRFDGELMHVAAVRGGRPGSEQSLQSARRPTRDVMAGRCIIDRTVIHVPDFETDPTIPMAAREIARARGFRATINVPMLKDREPIGVISVSRAETGAFSQTEIDLLQTFADQAVIAIENVRLFKELDVRNQNLTEALEQQKATSEILRVISQSPTDVQPVLDAVAENAARLCGAADAIIQRVDGDTMQRVAHFGAITSMSDARPVTPDTPSGRAILERQTVHVDDIVESFARGEYLETKALQQGSGFRTVLVVPLMRDDTVIGIITIRRLEVSPFTDQQIALLKTFADQAVIAIENVRLFKELESRNRELTTALDQQTATAEVLRVISSSPTDVQPVFDAIVQSAVRLLAGHSANVLRVTGNDLHLAAMTAMSEAADAETRATFPVPLTEVGVATHVIRSRRPRIVSDIETDPLSTARLRYTAPLRGFRSMLMVPMIHHEQVIGVIAVTRRSPGAFGDDEVALLQTFADQAVIAIENVRLFRELQARTQELQRSVEQLTALGEVGRAVSSTLDLETVLTTIVSRAVQLSGLDGGVVFEYDATAEEFEQRASTGQEALAEARRRVHIRKGDGVVGRTAITHEPVQVPDITREGTYASPLRESLVESGVRALLAVPMLREGHLIGSLVVARNAPGVFPLETIDLLRTFATQSALAIQNARLFREIEDKSRQLEVASQHKSEFLANMSHELRTPLNAIIGFSEVLTDRMFGDLNEKQEEYLKDIYASGTHLLSLINDILDLSKIEAGRMELELADFHLPTALDSALTLVRERAGRQGIALQTNVDDRLGQIQADERKVRQVVLNLLSNAIKFTPEGGRIEVGAAPKDGFVEVSVSDTGIGIAPEDQEKVFEEFRQVGTAAKKVEGTGLGLTLCRKFVELHGGRIWVKSQLGVGSTFTFTIPVLRAE